MPKQPNSKIGKKLDLIFLQRKHPNRHKHIKRCSTLLAIREKQIKITVKCHLTSIRVTIIKKWKISLAKDVDKLELSCIAAGNVKE